MLSPLARGAIQVRRGSVFQWVWAANWLFVGIAVGGAMKLADFGIGVAIWCAAFCVVLSFVAAMARK